MSEKLTEDDLRDLRMAADQCEAEACDADDMGHVERLRAIVDRLSRTPTTPSEEQREAVARIVDPEAWAERDERLTQDSPYRGPIRLHEKALVEPSLIKADAILAFLQKVNHG